MDIALIAETESVMQTVSDLVTDRCNNWKNQININKSKGMLFRKRKIKQSMVIFRLEIDALDYVPSCKYCKCITFGCGFFLKEFSRKAAYTKSSTLLNAIPVCIRRGTSRDTLIQIHANLLKFFFPANQHRKSG